MIQSIKDTAFHLLLLSFLLSFLKVSAAIDMINTTQMLRDGDTLVSSGGRFELGFFSPGKSTNRYVGIWYSKVPNSTVVWVANRGTPVRSTSGILKVVKPGLVVLRNETNNIIWSSNTSGVARNPVLQLSDFGNLVVREADDDHPENFLWQSFDHLSDTFLPGVNFGWNSVKGVTYLTSWKTDDDPAPGDYTFYVDPTGYPQNLLKRGDVILSRMGPWNGLRYSGIPNARQDLTYTFVFVMDENNTYYREETIDTSIISRVTLSPIGVLQRWVWVHRTQEWVLYLNIPADYCDTYKLCGAYGSCNVATSPFCRCLDKFLPKDPEGWVRSDWSNGCIRRTPLNCGKGDVFLKYSGIKLPDARHSWFKRNMTLEGCRVECLRSCTCMAYTQLDIRTEGSGCLFWSEELTDIRYLSMDGQDIYIRMASSELDSERKWRRINILGLTSLMVVVLGLSLMLCYWRRKKSYAYRRIGERYFKEFELPLFDLSTISKATNSLSINNMLGQGGYGPVYKAWTLYKEERSLELADAYIRETANPSEVERLIHISLLCVQQRPHDRPSMATVVAVLDNEIALPLANQPGFFTERDMLVANSRTDASSNEVTITKLEAR